MKPSEQRWPAQQAPDDFAERVVQAGLSAAQVNFGEVEPPPVRHVSRRSFGRAALGLSISALAVVASILVKTNPQESVQLATSRQIELQAVVEHQAREVDELRAKVAELEAELAASRSVELADKLRSALAASSQKQAKGAASARPATSRPACNCSPGDPLCSCL